MGNFCQIRGLYWAAQLVFAKSGDSGSGHSRDLCRGYCGDSPAVGMADADRSRAKWSSASVICSYDDGSSGSQDALGRLCLLSGRRSLSSGWYHRISIQCRSVTKESVLEMRCSSELSLHPKRTYRKIRCGLVSPTIMDLPAIPFRYSLDGKENRL